MDEHIEESKTDARAGETPHIVRYVLWISLALIVVLFAVLVLVKGY